MNFASNEEDPFQCIDMDQPRSGRAIVSPHSPVLLSPTSTKLPVGAQSKKRFRKRSVALHPLPDEQRELVRASFDAADTEGTGYITREALASMLKANYQPSEVETTQVMQWIDVSGNGLVDFPEYIICMASVMVQNDVDKSEGIDRAREALSFEMQRMNSSMKRAQEGAEEVPKLDLDKVEHAKEIVGEKNLEAMEARWKSLDTENRGYLDRDQVKELIRLTYVPSEGTIDGFMRVFTQTERGISREDFLQGMTLLYGDFSYMMPNMHSSVRMS